MALERLPFYKQRAWLLFCLFVVIFNLPNIPLWSFGEYSDAYIIDIRERLIKCIFISVLYLSFFYKPWVAWLVSWILFLWWLPVSLAVRLISGTSVNANLLGTLAASSLNELDSLFSSVSPKWLMFFLGWNGICLLIYKSLKNKTHCQWSLSLRLVVGSCALFFLCIPYFSIKSQVFETNAALEHAVDPLAIGDEVVYSDAGLPLAFPFELPWAVSKYLQAKVIVDTSRANLKLPVEPSHIALTAKSPDVVVLVIGESSSKSAWHLFNSAAALTTPMLEERQRADAGLIAFSNVIAVANLTRQVVPSLLTDEPILKPDGSPNKNATHSIVYLAGKAGYTTTWLSNQSAVGRHDGVIAAYADEADSKIFFNPASSRAQGTHDLVLLPAIKNQIKTNGRNFIVLHTLGSHFTFSHRYPSGFGIHSNAVNFREHYENSIQYTDLVIEGVISLLESSNKSAVMLYVSDHGQGLPDDICGKTELNRITFESYEIPSLVWLSSAYRAKNPESSRILHENKRGGYINTAVYQTLLDLIAPAHFRQNEGVASMRSSFLVAPKKNEHRSIVSPAKNIVSYEGAVLKNKCFIGVE